MLVDGAVDHRRQITTGHSDEPAIDVPPEQLSRKAPHPSRSPNGATILATALGYFAP